MHTGDSKPAFPRKLKKLYDIAGGIRDLQIKLEKYSGKKRSLSAYTESLQEELKHQKEQWRERYDDKIVRKAQRKLERFSYEELPSFVPVAFANARLEAVDEMRQKAGLTDEDLHTIRKRIKDIIYNTKLAKKNWKAAFRQLTDMPMDSLDKMATDIGDYNDARLMQEKLLQFLPEMTEQGEKRAIRTMVTKADKELKVKREGIISELERISNVNAE
jgi:CHAD domain-containing protein